MCVRLLLPKRPFSQSLSPVECNKEIGTLFLLFLNRQQIFLKAAEPPQLLITPAEYSGSPDRVRHYHNHCGLQLKNEPSISLLLIIYTESQALLTARDCE